ncbi:MAG: beta-lactamase family protein [Gemmatimonadetes bacterium]|nr:beta-lactamase family protein [Gemmatimonadota bacterium]
MRWALVAVTASLLGCAGGAKPATRSAPDRSALADSLGAIVRRFASSEELPGVAAGVWHRGVVYRGGFGTRGGGVGDPAVGPTTVFHMASVTKPFVATALMQLVEAGKVSLDGTVTGYLPYFAVKGPGAAGITIRQLLSHTAGLGDVTDYAWQHPEYDDGALERYIRGLKDSSLIAPPGETWAYSNIGFEILADVIAKVAGVPFETYLQQHLLTPLGMGKSTLLMTDIDSTLMAYGHTGDSAATRPVGYYPYNRRHAASSTLHSNVDDMLRWAAANLGRGSLDGSRILSDSSYRELWRPHRDITAGLAERARQAGVAMPFDSIAIGLSWFLPVRQGQRLVFHSGGDTGFASYLVLAPAEQAAVVVMINRDRVDPRPLAFELLDAALR